MKKRLISLIQLAVGIGILGLIFWNLHRSGDLGKLIDAVRTARANWPFLVVGMIGFGFSLFCCTVRWKYLLEAQGVRLPFGRLATLYLIGHFFSAFMMGATGGDVAKAYYVATETKHKRAEVISTVFFDRLVGLLALVGLIGIVTLSRLRFFLAHREMRVAMVFNLALLAAAVTGLVVVFRKNLFEQWPLFRRLEGATKLGNVVTRVYHSIRLCLSHPGLLTRTLSLSFLNHMIMVAWSMYMGMALNLSMGFVGMLTVVPLINAVGAIPVTPGGLGTRETAAIYLMGAMGISAANAVTFSLLCYAATMVWSLVGGVFYMVYAVRRGRVPPRPAP